MLPVWTDFIISDQFHVVLFNEKDQKVGWKVVTSIGVIYAWDGEDVSQKKFVERINQSEGLRMSVIRRNGINGKTEGSIRVSNGSSEVGRS